MTVSFFKITSFKSLKEVMEPFLSVRIFKSPKKVKESIFGIKNFKKKTLISMKKVVEHISLNAVRATLLLHE